MAPLSPRKTAVAAGVTEQGTAVLERAAQVLALGGRFSAWKMLVQVNAADTCISARYIFCWSNSKDECLDPRLRPARLDKPIYVDACLYENLSSYDVLILFFHIKIYLKILLKNTTFVPSYDKKVSKFRSYFIQLAYPGWNPEYERRYDIRYCSLIHYCSIFKRLNNTKVWWYEWSILFCK